MTTLAEAIRNRIGVVYESTPYWRQILSNAPDEIFKRRTAFSRETTAWRGGYRYIAFASPRRPTVHSDSLGQWVHPTICIGGATPMLHHAVSPRAYSSVAMVSNALVLIDPARLHWTTGDGWAVCVQWDVPRGQWEKGLDEIIEKIGVRK